MNDAYHQNIRHPREGGDPICSMATSNDAASLSALHRKCFGDAAWSFEQVQSSLVLPTTIAFMAQKGEQAIGLIFVQAVGDEVEILTFGVDPSLRRQGIGLDLLQKAFEVARAKGASRMFLEVAADNAAALALYEKAGFQIIGKRTGYYKHVGQPVDAVMMEKAL